MADECVHCTRLVEAIDDAYQRARIEFDAPESRSMDGVAWLSAHLAALDYAVHPSLTRMVPCAGATLRSQRRLVRLLQRLLRGAEQRRAGDGLAPRLPWDVSRPHLIRILDEHADAEREMVRQLADVIGPEQTEQLVGRYTRALYQGPTRPHLHGPRGRLSRRVRFRFDAARDHVLDTMDNRRAPFPRAPVQRPAVSRWGNYVQGASDFTDANRRT